MQKVLVTGAAGFIGFHFVNKLLGEGCQVVGMDNINDYYTVGLKLARLEEAGISTANIEKGKAIQSSINPAYRFIRLDLEDKEGVDALFSQEGFTHVCHLAAQAGVRYSIDNPGAYINSNILGFFHILEACRAYPVEHLLFASSSSVYGNNQKVPFSEDDRVDHPISLYAATKKSNELMAHTYSHLYGIPATGLRFFTVYGPWGRPDMAYFSFADAIMQGRTIRIFNNGELWRDFTYIDDIVEAMARVIQKPLDTGGSTARYRLFNIGNHTPVLLTDFIRILEEALGRKAEKEYVGMQPGDVEKTFADVDQLAQAVGFKPETELKDGLVQFVKWYEQYKKK